jgi:hypothetical protein
MLNETLMPSLSLAHRLEHFVDPMAVILAQWKQPTTILDGGVINISWPACGRLSREYSNTLVSMQEHLPLISLPCAD